MTPTREQVLARYDPIRASIQRVLKLAEGSCAKADWARAMKHVAPWAEPAALAQASAPEMLTDIALFEPNQRGRRVFDRFLSDKASQRLSAPDFALAQRMAGAVFSIFRVAERHEAAGLWLEDMLRGDRRLWLVDRSFEARAPEGAVFGMRLFEAEAFHAGFGIIVPVAEDMLDFCVSAAAAGQRLPVRHSLAATLYGDVLSEALPPGEVEMEMMEALLDLVAPEEPPPASKKRRRKRAG
jgi:hypothetical protein